MDQIEKSLAELADKLHAAWRGSRCMTCPLAELAALAAATRTFYAENRAANKAAKFDRWGYPIV